MNIKEFEKLLRVILKNRLKIRSNGDYVKWRLENKNPNNDLDHIAKKRNDLLLAEREHSHHIMKEYDDYTENFLNAIEGIFDYVEYLQEKLNEQN